MKILNPKIHKDSFTSWQEYYWQYQFLLAEDFILPMLEKWGIDIKNKRVLDLGCGEGGFSSACMKHGAIVMGCDYDEKRIANAKSLAEKHEYNTNFIVCDILDPELPRKAGGQWDFIVLRDVIEHLPLRDNLYRNIKMLLSTGGMVFCCFPPYFSPFGMHQQVWGRGIFKYIPYIQIIPYGIFNRITKFIVVEKFLNDARILLKTKLTLKKIFNELAENGFIVMNKKVFLIRYSHELRYGLKTVECNFFSRIPLLREILISGVYFVFKI